MLLSHKADYALRAVRHLASLPKGKLASINAIAEAEAIPREFLAKILKDLTTAKVLLSHKGVHGGYELARPPREVSMLDVIVAIEGPIHLSLCTEANGAYCNDASTCHIRGFWVAQDKLFKTNLAAQKFSKLAPKRD